MKRPKRLRWMPIIAQAALLLAVVAAIAMASQTVVENLRARGLASGFAFLDQPAGFDIAFSLVPYEPTNANARVFLVGALNTLLIAGLGILCSSTIGLLAGIARRATSPLMRGLSTTYIEIARNTPLPVQLLVWYALLSTAPPPREAISLLGVGFISNRGVYLPAVECSVSGGTLATAFTVAVALSWIGVRAVIRRRRDGLWAPHPAWAMAFIAIGFCAFVAPVCSGIDVPHREGFGFAGGWEIPPPLLALLVALSFYTGGYIAEVVRGGLDAIPRGQTEAARALGFSRAQLLRLVTLPQAMRVMVPPLINQYVSLIKNSSLAIVVGYPDLVATFGGTTLNQTGQAIETLFLVFLFYLVVSVALSALANTWNARQAIWAGRR
jgi:general L-amino acid transport system permease protein